MRQKTKGLLKTQFQTKRCRLLYFIYQKKKIRSEKSKLKRAFDYSSDGHLHPDLNYLIQEGLLNEKDGFLRVTRYGRREFLLLDTLKTTTLISILFFVYFFISPILLYQNLPFNFQWALYTASIVFFTIAVLTRFALKTFEPMPPEHPEELL